MLDPIYHGTLSITMKNKNDNDDSKKPPPPSKPSSNQNDDSDNSDHNEDINGSKNSIKPGAVKVNEEDALKIKKKKEIRMKYNFPSDRAEALPGHYPKNEEPGSNFMRKTENQEKMEKNIAKDTNNNSTKPGAVKVKDSEDSNMKGTKKLRSQTYKRKAIESTTIFKSDNEDMESQVNSGSTNIAPNIREFSAFSSIENPFADEEEAHHVITSLSNEEGTNNDQDRGVVFHHVREGGEGIGRRKACAQIF